MGSNAQGIQTIATQSFLPKRTKIESIKLSSPNQGWVRNLIDKFNTGDKVKIEATIKKGDEFMHYNVYIKDPNGNDIDSKINQTANSFSYVWDSDSNSAGNYTVWVVAYKTSHEAEDKKSNGFKLNPAPNINIEVQENTGNGNIRVGGTYMYAENITLDCVNITDGTEIRIEQCEFDGKNWWYNKPVVGGKEYRFAVRAFDNKGQEKWAQVEEIAENIDLEDIMPLGWESYNYTIESFDSILLSAYAELKNRFPGVYVNVKNGVRVNTWAGLRTQNCPIGAAGSAHKTGEALDLHHPTKLSELRSFCESAEGLKLGIRRIENEPATPTWVHIDVKQPNMANWNDKSKPYIFYG